MSDKLSRKRSLKQQFISELIVPNVIKRCPPDVLDVDFLSGEKAYLGNTIDYRHATDPIVKVSDHRPDQLTDRIYRVQWETDPTKVYLLSMVDIDRDHGQHVQWMIANIHGDRTFSGDTIQEYQPPKPAKGARHRFVELLFEQPRELFSEELDQIDCEHFDLQQFADRNNLSPIAGNFFISRNV